MTESTLFDDLSRWLADTGLIVRGGFHPGAADSVPAPGGKDGAQTLVLIGNAGSAMWAAFRKDRPGGPEPLNLWCERTIGTLAHDFGAKALFPFEGPPFLPFLAWGARADAVHPSPLGMLIHPDFGLWHAYRGALAFRESLPLPPRDARPRPCDTCADKPCLATCPVGAFNGKTYDVAACIGHVSAAAGRDCAEDGCRARRACPLGSPYGAAQMRFHMAAFIRTIERKN